MSDEAFLGELQTLLRKLEQTSERSVPLGGITRAMIARMLCEVKARMRLLDPHGDLVARIQKLEIDGGEK